MTARVVFIADETGLFTDAFDFAGGDGEVLDARDLVSLMLGIDSDPLTLLAQVEADHGYLRAVLNLVHEPLFHGLQGGKLDAIAAARIAASHDLCLVVGARVAADGVMSEFMQ